MKRARRRILIIDDEPDLLELLAFRLETEGAEVVTAEDGRTGLEKLRERKPDVVFLDLLMPGLDGWEVQRRIREDPALKGLPVVLVTASPQSEVRERAAREGFRKVVSKPFETKELVQLAKSRF